MPNNHDTRSEVSLGLVEGESFKSRSCMLNACWVGDRVETIRVCYILVIIVVDYYQQSSVSAAIAKQSGRRW